MANFEAKEFNFSEINNGERYENGDIVSENAINSPIEASYYAVQTAKKFGAKVEQLESLAWQEIGMTSYPPLSAYPVGSIFISTADISPAEIFGGTWARIKDMFLLTSGDKYLLGATGGSATHTLTISEMPSHYHDQGTLAPSETARNPNLENGDPNYWAFSGSATGVTASTGGGEAFDIMPPYLVVNAWERVG